MSGVATETQTRAAAIDESLLRETIEALAPIERAPVSEGERQAAHWIADRLERLGADSRIEEERAFSGFPKPLAAMSAIGAAAGIAAASGRRVLGGIAGAGAAAAIADDISNGRRDFRRLTMRRKPTWNVVAEAGDRGAARTLVVLAHHDAAQTGAIFSQSPQRKLHEIWPAVVERADTSAPLWWPVVGGPLLSALGGLLGSRKLALAGGVVAAGSAVAFADIARSPTVPGANDNLSGVAVLVALADRLRSDPPPGLRVLLVSCGSEEVLQGGIHGFASRHFPSLPPETTWFVNLDSVGSPHLALVEGEGTLAMEDFEPGFKAEVGGLADRAGVPLRRNLRARVSSDSVVPHRAGYRIAYMTSVNGWKSVSNYHWPSDVPENIDYSTVADAARLTALIAERLASG